ncbi:hypothetical protein H4Q26_008545 [Puccinia striiformis f. sp. tritici PST-130]|nr:hypothetical protein H4Q26_008545 [Puccinia striiformis f. sp. tritici PST-130]
MSIDGTSSHACTTSTYLITSALEALRQRYDEIDLDADCRESPLFPIPGKIYRRDNRRFSRREALSTDELDALKDRLIQMQTRFLPSLQQQLAGILKSLESTDLQKEPIRNALMRWISYPDSETPWRKLAISSIRSLSSLSIACQILKNVTTITED